MDGVETHFLGLHFSWSPQGGDIAANGGSSGRGGAIGEAGTITWSGLASAETSEILITIPYWLEVYCTFRRQGSPFSFEHKQTGAKFSL